MSIVVFATWLRTIVILYVVKEFSVLLVTTVKMTTAGTNFIMLTFYIILAIALLCMSLFGTDKDDSMYTTLLTSFINLFVAFIGGPDYGGFTNENMIYLHTGVIILHVYLTNIFMLNYLVAILSTVYEEMM